jgi:hypothetical protein
MQRCTQEHTNIQKHAYRDSHVGRDRMRGKTRVDRWMTRAHSHPPLHHCNKGTGVNLRGVRDYYKGFLISIQKKVL